MLFEIAFGIGTSLSIDEVPQPRLFGNFARIFVDVNISGKLFDSVLVERDGYAFSVSVEYERKHAFCHNCKVLGHTIMQCKKISTNSTAAGSELQQKRHTLTHDKHKMVHSNGKSLKSRSKEVEVPQTKEHTNILTDSVLKQSPVAEGLEQHLEQLE